MLPKRKASSMKDDPLALKETLIFLLGIDYKQHPRPLILTSCKRLFALWEVLKLDRSDLGVGHEILLAHTLRPRFWTSSRGSGT